MPPCFWRRAVKADSCDHPRYHLQVTKHQEFLYPRSRRERFACASLAVRSTMANRSSRRRTLSCVSSASSRRRSTAAEQDGQDRSITLSGQSFPIGCPPERRRLGCWNPVAQSRIQPCGHLERDGQRSPVQGSIVLNQPPRKQVRILLQSPEALDGCMLLKSSPETEAPKCWSMTTRYSITQPDRVVMRRNSPQVRFVLVLRR